MGCHQKRADVQPTFHKLELLQHYKKTCVYIRCRVHHNFGENFARWSYKYVNEASEKSYINSKEEKNESCWTDELKH